MFSEEKGSTGCHIIQFSPHLNTHQTQHTNVYPQIIKYSTQMQFTVISKDNLTRFIGI